MCLAQMVALPGETWIRLVIRLIAGPAVFYRWLVDPGGSELRETMPILSLQAQARGYAQWFNRMFALHSHVTMLSSRFM